MSVHGRVHKRVHRQCDCNVIILDSTPRRGADSSLPPCVARWTRMAECDPEMSRRFGEFSASLHFRRISVRCHRSLLGEKRRDRVSVCFSGLIRFHGFDLNGRRCRGVSRTRRTKSPPHYCTYDVPISTVRRYDNEALLQDGGWLALHLVKRRHNYSYAQTAHIFFSL